MDCQQLPFHRLAVAYTTRLSLPPNHHTLPKGASLTSVDETGHTPLMVTIWRGDDGVKSFDFLMESEQVLKSLAVKNADGHDAYAIAVSRGDERAMKKLGEAVRGR